MNQARFRAEKSPLEQYIFRSSIYYQAIPNLSFWFGYDGIPTSLPTFLNQDSNFFYQQRLWPQVFYTHPITPNTKLSSRSRFEFIWNTKFPGTGLRFRQALDAKFTNWNKYQIGIDIYDEFFLFLNHPFWVGQQTFDQNRIFVGMIFGLSNNSSLYAGYLNIFRPRGSLNFIDHIIFLNWNINFSRTTLLTFQKFHSNNRVQYIKKDKL